MVGSYSEGYTHGVRSKPTAAITADTPTSAANKIRRNYTSAVRLYIVDADPGRWKIRRGHEAHCANCSVEIHCSIEIATCIIVSLVPRLPPAITGSPPLRAIIA